MAMIFNNFGFIQLIWNLLKQQNLKEKPDYSLVLAWNFFDEIKKKNADLAHKFISIKDLEI